MNLPVLLVLAAVMSFDGGEVIEDSPEAPISIPTSRYHPTAIAGVSARRDTETQFIFSRSNGILFSCTASDGRILPVILTTRHSVEGYETVTMGLYCGVGPADSQVVDAFQIPISEIVFHPDSEVDLAAVIIDSPWPGDLPLPSELGIDPGDLVFSSDLEDGSSLEVMGRPIRGISLLGAGPVELREGILSFLQGSPAPFYSDVRVLNGYSGSPVMVEDACPEDGIDDPRVAGIVSARVMLVERDGSVRHAAGGRHIFTEIISSENMLLMLDAAVEAFEAGGDR